MKPLWLTILISMLVRYISWIMLTIPSAWCSLTRTMRAASSAATPFRRPWESKRVCRSSVLGIACRPQQNISHLLTLWIQLSLLQAITDVQSDFLVHPPVPRSRLGLQHPSELTHERIAADCRQGCNSHGHFSHRPEHPLNKLPS